MQSQSGSIQGGGYGSTLAVARESPPDYVIKYESTQEPCPPGGHELSVNGSEGDAIDAIRNLIESGRSTPSRIRLYGNLNPIVNVAVTFPPSAKPSR